MIISITRVPLNFPVVENIPKEATNEAKCALRWEGLNSINENFFPEPFHLDEARDGNFFDVLTQNEFSSRLSLPPDKIK